MGRESKEEGTHVHIFIYGADSLGYTAEADTQRGKATACQ